MHFVFLYFSVEIEIKYARNYQTFSSMRFKINVVLNAFTCAKKEDALYSYVLPAIDGC